MRSGKKNKKNMENINLTNLKVYKTMSKTDFMVDDFGNEIADSAGNKIKNFIVCNGAKQIANFIYSNMNGLAYLALSVKLYNSGETFDLNEEEKELFMTALGMVSPMVIDAINERIKGG